MTAAPLRPRRWLPLGLLLAVWSASCLAGVDSAAGRWVGTWATSPMVENSEANTPALADATLRQVARVVDLNLFARPAAGPK